jgi:hypothetical protein
LQQAIVEIIRQIVPEDGEHIWGFADLSGLLHKRFKGFDYGISIGKRLDDRVMDSIILGPTAEYYDLYISTNAYLLNLVIEVSKAIEGLGIKTRAIQPTSSRVDRSADYARTLRHDFSHKMAGTRAGLG